MNTTQRFWFATIHTILGLGSITFGIAWLDGMARVGAIVGGMIWLTFAVDAYGSTPR